MLNTDERATCPVLSQPGNFHFERRCEDCDVVALSRLSIGAVEDRYRDGRITQDEYEAYMYVWAILSPLSSREHWRYTPDLPDVRRIARKLLRWKGFEIPSELAA